MNLREELPSDWEAVRDTHLRAFARYRLGTGTAPSLRIPDGGFQAIKLSGYEPWMTGTFVYAEPFWRHDLVGLRDPTASR